MANQTTEEEPINQEFLNQIYTKCQKYCDARNKDILKKQKMEIKLQEDFGINIIEQQYQRYKDDVKNNVVDEDKKELQDNEGDEVITVEEMS